MRKILLIIGMLLFSFSAKANLVYQGAYNPNMNLQEYFSAEDEDYSKSIIYVFFNNNPCYECPQTIELIEQIYNQNYADEYSLFLINYQNDQEYNFIATYNLSQPLEVVMVRVNDGAAFGYKKIENLQNQISDTVSFENYFKSQVNSFLGNNE